MGVGFGRSHRPQQLLVAANMGAPGQNGGIAIYLTHHQHQLTTIIGPGVVLRLAHIVFADPVFP